MVPNKIGKNWLYVLAAVVIVAGAAVYFLRSGEKIMITGEKNNSNALLSENILEEKETAAEPAAENPLTGEVCPGGKRRPLAVMLAGDKVVRPLSGITQADLVVEMPALTDGITRFMALFVCETPSEIGSARSARHDFMPFAKSFDAIYAHWGGSYLALDLLNKKALDNIDALPNPHDAFYRRASRLAPHNGFTSFDRLRNAAEKLGYRMETQAAPYPRIKDEAVLSVDQNIAIDYPAPYNVDFAYDHVDNSYTRHRGGEKEVEETGQRAVKVKNVVVMIASSQQISVDYNEVDVEGEGALLVYRNGEVVKGKWKRAEETYGQDLSADSRYHFLDAKGSEIGFVPGKIWISVVQPNERVEQTFK